MINLDELIIVRRDEEYQKERENVFVKMCAKHYSKSCLCLKKGKICQCDGVIDLNRFGDVKYVEDLYKKGMLDTIYNISQSVTQSLRASTGKILK